MKYFLLLLSFIIFAAPLSASAQTPRDSAPKAASSGSPWAAPFPGVNVPMTTEGEVDTQPTCFRVINQAPYTVIGSMQTNFYVDKERRKARHSSNFRLEKGQSQPFCTYGPFYEGRKLLLVLRTFLPIFSCHTMVDADIYIKGEVREDGTTKTWAICLDAPPPSGLIP